MMEGKHKKHLPRSSNLYGGQKAKHGDLLKVEKTTYLERGIKEGLVIMV